MLRDADTAMYRAKAAGNTNTELRLRPRELQPGRRDVRRTKGSPQPAFTSTGGQRTVEPYPKFLPGRTSLTPPEISNIAAANCGLR